MSTLRPFGLISTTIWQSEKFTGLKALDTRLAYIWLHTSAKTCAGVLRVGPAHLFEEVDFVETLDRASEIFEEMEAAKIIKWQRPYVVITNFLAFNNVKSYRHAIGAFSEVLAMPESEAKTQLIKELQQQPGSRDLSKWRNKNDDPHPVLFQISEYFSDNLNPSGTVQEESLKPSAKKRRKNTNEKRENITPFSPNEPLKRLPTPDLHRRCEGPTEATKRSRLARGE
ncbi:MAG: hypothetical protein JXR14_05305 [Paracoccaceae bacterium]